MSELNKDLVQKFLTSIVVGDAMGSPFFSLKNRHIKATIKNSEFFPDVFIALKHHEEKWKKPGLYSFISQTVILLSVVLKDSTKSFTNEISMLDGIEEFFRYTDYNILNYFLNIKNFDENYKKTDLDIPALVLISIAFAFQFSGNLEDEIFLIVKFVSQFTSSGETIASALLFVLFIKMATLSEEIFSFPIKKAIEKNREIIDVFSSEPYKLFDLGLTPDNVILEQKKIGSLLSLVLETDNLKEAKAVLLNEVKKSSLENFSSLPVKKSPVILSLAFVYLSFLNNLDLEEVLVLATREGGQSAVFTSIVATLFVAVYKSNISEDILEGLVNRKNILTTIEKISNSKIKNFNLVDFIQSEKKLTQKFEEELAARLKKVKKKGGIKNKQNLKKKDQFAPIKESWTKQDKARWKKEKKYFENNQD